MLLSIILLALGFILLVLGADWLVNGASALAKKLGVSDLIVGLTVVAFGTSLPELTVNVFNSTKQLNSAVFGNVIGSNIFNIAFILGITGLIRPIKLEIRSVAYEIPFSLFIIMVFILLVNDQLWNSPSLLGRWDAAILLILFIAFCLYIFRTSSNREEVASTASKPIYKSALLIMAGLCCLVGGGISDYGQCCGYFTAFWHERKTDWSDGAFCWHFLA